jgi:hypothetical protein
MGLGAVIHIPSFIKFGSAVQKSIRGTHKHTDKQTCRYTQTQLGDRISLLSLLQNKESGMKLKRIHHFENPRMNVRTIILQWNLQN